MKDYILNDNGVCLNPDVLLEYNEGKIRFSIRAMECADGLWVSGCCIDIGFSGSSSPVMPSRGVRRTKADLIKHELGVFLKTLEKNFERTLKGDTDEDGKRVYNTPMMLSIKNAMNWVNTQLGPKQLTFDF